MKRAVVKMEVMATVEFPDSVAETMTYEDALSKAMGAVSQFHESDCGPPGRLLWAKVWTEVSDHDCEIIEED